MLNKIKDLVQHVLELLSHSMNVEAAIIDTNFKLVCYTKGYIEEKGYDVHKLFVEKVFELGEIVAANPGCMEYCEGCRFQDNCPAALELLTPITANNKNVGVISISFFSNRNMTLFEDNLPMYRNVLINASKLISEILISSSKNKLNLTTSKLIDDDFSKIKYTLNSIVGSQSKILDLKSKISKIASSPSAVLIVGETGTGKELVARSIHHTSQRENKPFIPINCAAIPESLLESELFGYEEGAFSGAKKKGQTGLFELANGGTLFLDEIGDMTFHLQAKLLRVLQDHQIRRIGGSKFINLDVRIIAASNQNIENLILENKFRSDLYYRLNIINLTVPPLRSRKNDIDLLSKHFLKKYSFEFNKFYSGFEESVIEKFKNYDWPGNVRELQNTIEYMVNLEDSNILTVESLPDKFRTIVCSNSNSLQDQVDNFEKKIICDYLETYGSDLSGKEKIASQLNIGLRTLYRKIEKLGVENNN